MEFKHQIDFERCKGCGLCVAICPKNALEISETLNNRGYFPGMAKQTRRLCILHNVRCHVPGCGN